LILSFPIWIRSDPEPPKPQPAPAVLKYQAPVVVEDTSANSASFAPVNLLIDSIKNGNVNEKLVVINTIIPLCL